MDIRCSIVIPVLQSYEPLHRQLLYFEQFLPDDWEVIIMDDGSEPPIDENPDDYSYNLRIVQTHDRRPWTQPRARNIGVMLAEGKYIYMPGIDHITTPDVVRWINQEDFIKMKFYRTWGAILISDCGLRNEECKERRPECDNKVKVCTNFEILKEYGLKKKDIDWKTIHYDIYAMRKDIYWEVGGYDEKFCSKYGKDDVDFHTRYGKYVREIIKRNPELQSEYTDKLHEMTYVYPEPAQDRLKLFHNLNRKDRN